MATGDTINPVKLGQLNPAAMAVQFDSDAWGGATVTLQGSNDEGDSPAHWFDVKDVYGAVVQATADTMFEVSNSCLWLRCKIESGTSDSVNCRIVSRG